MTGATLRWLALAAPLIAPAAGLRPVQIWVPDTRAAGFAEECARQSRLVRGAEGTTSQADHEAWFEASDKTGWTG
ncbi:MAG: antitoxin MazE family protein [Pseudomonadota bacterium]|nr:antitoxin MazE family protein [Pseudomonadota bacterium]